VLSLQQREQQQSEEEEESKGAPKSPNAQKSQTIAATAP
jgi:hypothetical protein